MVTGISCQEDESIGDIPVPKHNRTFAIDINEGVDITYDEAFQEARSLGIEEVKLSWDWDLMENDQGFDFTIPDIANLYYPLQPIPVTLIFRPANTNLKSVPTDLKDTPFDSQEFIDRFKAFLDGIKSRTPDLDVEAIYLGNEIDILFGDNEIQWNQFITFFEAATAHVRRLWGNEVKIGTIGTLRAMNNTSIKPFYDRLHQLSDVIAVTYYPIDNGFNMNDPQIVAEDFDLLVENYGNKEIRFTECGYSSGVEVGSSEAQQAAFIENVFTAWDKYHTQITHIDFTWMHDISEAKLLAFQDIYQIYDASFVSYLGTLGLKNNNGQNKQAFETLKEALSNRGW